MTGREKDTGRFRFARVWMVLLAFLVHASSAAALDDCERLDANGQPRDCTYLEEMHECVDDVNDSFDECLSSAEGDGLISQTVNFLGCEAAFLINLTACAVSVTSDWALGGTF